MFSDVDADVGVVKVYTNGRNKSQRCCVLLGVFGQQCCVRFMDLKVGSISNYTRQVPTSANIIVVPCKRTQYVGPNNVAALLANNVASI